MKRLFCYYLLLCFTLFAGINDELKLFSQDEFKLLEKRIEDLEKSYGVEFEVYTGENQSQIVQKKLNNVEKTVIITISREADKVANVKVSVSMDLDLSSYSEEVNKVLDDLEVLIVNEEYSDYTYELLANIGDIINLLELEMDNSVPKKADLSGIFITAFKVLIGLIISLVVFYLYRVFLKNKNLTTCNSCGKNMIIDQEVEKEKSIMKVYKCPSCGKIKRVTSKRY